MARVKAAQRRKTAVAERLGRFGRPLPHWFLDGRSGCGTVALAALAAVLTSLAAFAARAS